MASAKDFFSEAEQEAIVNAIRAAELHTSGEIRVHADNRCYGDAFKRAQIVFHSLQMDRKPFQKIKSKFYQQKGSDNRTSEPSRSSNLYLIIAFFEHKR